MQHISLSRVHGPFALSRSALPTLTIKLTFLSAQEPHGGEQGSVLHHRPLPLVPPLLHHPLPQQDGHPGRQDPDV